MIDIVPLERAISSGFELVRIGCPRCGATAWRIIGRIEYTVDAGDAADY
jgi:hypothetical protein